MTALTPVRGTLKLVHGMEHAGLGPEALAIERSAKFKTAFVETISSALGLAEGPLDLAAAAPAGLDEFLGSFGEDGHPPEEKARQFLDRFLADRVGPDLQTGPLLRDCCIRFLGGWLNCGGYALQRGGEPWNVLAAVERYERDTGPIAEAAVRAELAAIAVYLQIEWVIPL